MRHDWESDKYSEDERREDRNRQCLPLLFEKSWSVRMEACLFKHSDIRVPDAE